MFQRADASVHRAAYRLWRHIDIDQKSGVAQWQLVGAADTHFRTLTWLSFTLQPDGDARDVPSVRASCAAKRQPDN